MQKKILIILPSDKFLHRQILEGILEYGRKRGPWQFHFETGDHYEQGIGKGQRWGCTGIIALVREREQVNSLIRMEIPCVFLNPPPAQKGEREPPSRVTFVRRNQENVGQTAATYFLERGYRSFAFVGLPQPADWCERRLAGFRRCLRDRGMDCAIFPQAPQRARKDFDLESRYLTEWLRSLKPKTALYVPRDRRALQILGLCLDAEISVPGTLSVLGTDDDALLCESTSPSLSSIALDGRSVGNLCARLLDRHMRGRKVEPLVDLAFPRVVTRQSTDEHLVPDRFLSQALAIVRKDLSTSHAVGELASRLGISRRTLENKAKLVLGTSLKSEINRIRLAEAVRLISNTDLPIQAIAEKCGFCCASHLNKRFKEAFKHAPSVFRYQDPK